MTAVHEVAILEASIQLLSSDAATVTIRNAHASVNPNGMLFISGADILDDSRPSASYAVFYNLAFMTLYDAGQHYTRAEHAD